MIPDWRDIRKECERCGDDYYRAMRDWSMDEQDGDTGPDKCYAMALIYRDSLKELLESLKKDTDSGSHRSEIDHAMELQKLLAVDIKDIDLVKNSAL